jgi:8-oxo-dGTP pyrophosphatase MutT (NUDIX family)
MSKLFKVATKALIFNDKKDKIILINISKFEDEKDDFGLPGGHIEENEAPDQAINRELYEECGIVCDNLQRTDFFMHINGKLVLAYIGSITEQKLVSAQGNIEGIPVWITKKEFEKIKNFEPNYQRFVKEHWS